MVRFKAWVGTLKSMGSMPEALSGAGQTKQTQELCSHPSSPEHVTAACIPMAGSPHGAQALLCLLLPRPTLLLTPKGQGCVSTHLLPASWGASAALLCHLALTCKEDHPFHWPDCSRDYIFPQIVLGKQVTSWKACLGSSEVDNSSAKDFTWNCLLI